MRVFRGSSPSGLGCHRPTVSSEDYITFATRSDRGMRIVLVLALGMVPAMAAPGSLTIGEARGHHRAEDVMAGRALTRPIRG